MPIINSFEIKKLIAMNSHALSEKAKKK